MYKSIVSEKNYKLAVESTKYLSERLNLESSYKKDHVWIVYGSLITNQLKEGSDLDFMLITNSNGNPRRISASYKNHPVTLYIVPKKEFVKDGREGKYGGYFCGKTLNPFISIGNLMDDKEILSVSLELITPFMVYLSKNKNIQNLNRNNIVASVFQSYSFLYPHYHSYFFKHYVSPKFQDIWRIMGETMPNTLIKLNLVIKISRNKYRFTGGLLKNINRKAVEYTSRFWAFGAYSHDRFDFPDLYF